jgi:uncharacterized protein
MPIHNLTRNKIIAKDYDLCTSMWQKARGLMFSPKRSLVMVFKRPERVPLHMLFVFFPIDVIYLDSHKRVTELKMDFRPFTFHDPIRKASYVIEVPSPAGKICRVGDRLSVDR